MKPVIIIAIAFVFLFAPMSVYSQEESTLPESSVPEHRGFATCEDGIDNDLDSLIDLNDPGCRISAEELLETELDGIKKQNEELSNITESLKEKINSLDTNLLNHEKWSGNLTYIGIIIGSVGVIAGLLIGIAQIIPSYYDRKEGTKKRKKMTEQLKENLVEILDLSKTLEGSSPNTEKLLELRIWKLIKLRTKVMSTIITGSMTLLDMKLIHRTLGYLNYMDEQFDIADKKQRVSYIWFTKHTKSFLDKFFPEHVEERRVFLENMEEQAKWAEMEHDKEMEKQLEWYEENYEPELYQNDEDKDKDD